MRKCTILFLLTILLLGAQTKSPVVVDKNVMSMNPNNVVCEEIGKKIEEVQKINVIKPITKVKKKGKKAVKREPTFHKFESNYCKLTTKDLSINYEMIEVNVLNSFDILYDSLPLDSNKLNFLIEITMAESRLGYYTNHFKQGGTKGKGPWQIDRCAFNATKDVINHPHLKPYLDRIKQKTGIDWRAQVQWEHCNYVFFGAITAQLLLIIKRLDIHDSIHSRSKQWKVHYNTYLGKGRPQDYLNRVSEVRTKLSI